MTIINIKEILGTLLRYEDSEITHTIRSTNNTFSLTYSKELKTFQLKNMETGSSESYTDMESMTLALYKIIDPDTKKVAE